MLKQNFLKFLSFLILFLPLRTVTISLQEIFEQNINTETKILLKPDIKIDQEIEKKRSQETRNLTKIKNWAKNNYKAIMAVGGIIIYYYAKSCLSDNCLTKKSETLPHTLPPRTDDPNLKDIIERNNRFSAPERTEYIKLDGNTYDQLIQRLNEN